ncbi:hypothetical protein ACO3TA_01235 [Methanocaldococcus sp. 28A]
MEVYTISAQAKDLLKKFNNNRWRNMDRVIPLMNAVVTGYVIAVSKVLGRGATAMSQMLIREIGDVVAEMVDQIIGDEQLKYNAENRTELIKSALLEMGISKDVEVISEGKENEKIYKIKITNSIFHPTHMVLVHQGYKEFPLSPEGLICAAIVRKVLRSKEGGNSEAQVRVNTKLPTDGKTLIVEIKEINAK